jgi:hypothetical protein
MTCCIRPALGKSFTYSDPIDVDKVSLILANATQCLCLFPVDIQPDTGTGRQAIRVNTRHYLALCCQLQQFCFRSLQCRIALICTILQRKVKPELVPSSSIAGGIKCITLPSGKLAVAAPANATFLAA